ncbi:MAG: hypothetical protein NTY61_02735, partial [Candidatus Parcubacteria bacterium]|nr:hypothetical protein [Candidatus Parcubacteria bacterium]
VRLCKKYNGVRIFGNEDSLWFAYGTKTDPGVQRALGVAVCPDSAKPQAELRPCSAEDVIARSKYHSKLVLVLIRLLSEKALTIRQILSAIKQDPDYPTDGLSDEQLVKRTVVRLSKKRIDGRIFGHKDSFWFVYGTKADPAYQPALSAPASVKPQTVDLRSNSSVLTILIFNLLISQPLTLGQLMARIRSCSDFDTTGMSNQTLRYHIFNRLHKRDDLFVRQPDPTGSIPKSNAFWGVKPGVTEPETAVGNQRLVT